MSDRRSRGLAIERRIGTVCNDGTVYEVVRSSDTGRVRLYALGTVNDLQVVR